MVALIYPQRARILPRYTARNYTVRADDRSELSRAVEEVNGLVQSYKRIVRFVPVADEFPKNASHKIKRAGLEKLAMEG